MSEDKDCVKELYDSIGYYDMPECEDTIPVNGKYLVEALEELEEKRQLFDMQWKRDMETIMLAQQAGLCDDMTWPDRGNLTMFLAERLNALRKVVDCVRVKFMSLRMVEMSRTPEEVSKTAMWGSFETYCRDELAKVLPPGWESAEARRIESMEMALIKLHVDGVLSEGQVAKATDLDRITIRELADMLRE